MKWHGYPPQWSYFAAREERENSGLAEARPAALKHLTPNGFRAQIPAHIR